MFTENEGEGPGAHQASSHSPGRLLRSIRRIVGEELGGLAWGGGVWALRLLAQLEEHLLLPLLLVQILFQSLLARPKLVPPFLQVLIMALIQRLQLLGLVLYQEVALFILEQIPGRTGEKSEDTGPED